MSQKNSQTDCSELRQKLEELKQLCVSYGVEAEEFSKEPKYERVKYKLMQEKTEKLEKDFEQLYKEIRFILPAELRVLGRLVRLKIPEADRKIFMKALEVPVRAGFFTAAGIGLKLPSKEELLDDMLSYSNEELGELIVVAKEDGCFTLMTLPIKKNK